MRARVRRLRPVGFSAATGDELPGWVPALPDRPTTYVTLGTFLNTDRTVFQPQGADNFLNAERCAAAGVGPVLRPGAVHPGAVRRAVRAVLDDLTYRTAARRLAAEIAQMPGPDAVVCDLVGLQQG